MAEQTAFDVFLSYNSKDRPAVIRLAERLQAQGLKVWLDKWELRPGYPWKKALEDAIETIPMVAVFVGQEGVGPWQSQEIYGFLGEFVEHGKPVIPVLLEDCPAIPKLPFFLKQFTWVDLRDGHPDEGFYRLVWGITAKKPEQLEAIDIIINLFYTISAISIKLLCNAITQTGSYRYAPIYRLYSCRGLNSDLLTSY